jgi:hypothetical protein
MADDWALERAREIRQWIESSYNIRWDAVPAATVDNRIAAELRKERENANESEGQAAEWRDKAGRLDVEIRKERERAEAAEKRAADLTEQLVEITAKSVSNCLAADALETQLKDAEARTDHYVHYRIPELEALLEQCEKRVAPASPIGWRYKVLVNKHVTGDPLPGEISMPDIYRQPVWGKPGAWRYSDGPDKPSADWMCEAEPLYAGAPADDRDKQIIEALKALLVETCEHLEALVKITREGMQEPVEAAKRRRLRSV